MFVNIINTKVTWCQTPGKSTLSAPDSAMSPFDGLFSERKLSFQPCNFRFEISITSFKIGVSRVL